MTGTRPRTILLLALLAPAFVGCASEPKPEPKPEPEAQPEPEPEATPEPKPAPKKARKARKKRRSADDEARIAELKKRLAAKKAKPKGPAPAKRNRLTIPALEADGWPVNVRGQVGPRDENDVMIYHSKMGNGRVCWGSVPLRAGQTLDWRARTTRAEDQGLRLLVVLELDKDYIKRIYPSSRPSDQYRAKRAGTYRIGVVVLESAWEARRKRGRTEDVPFVLTLKLR